MNKTIVIYHGGCRDGFCTAWIVNKYFNENNRINNDPDIGTITYHPGYYGQPPPDVKDKDVIIVDFTYNPEIMGLIAYECKSLIWLDHHKTALPINDLMMMLIDSTELYKSKLNFVFDNSRSGAGIAWDYFFPNVLRPWLVSYVEDRDLWNKKLPKTDTINAYIACLEFNFDVWTKASEHDILKAEVFGISAEMKTEQYVREVYKNAYFTKINQPNIEPYKDMPNWTKIPTVNICQVDCSEVMHELCKKYPQSPFSMYWFKRQDGMYQYGMRSIGDFDVSIVAKLFGGGGHKNAAGFQLDYLLEELK